MFRPFIQPSLTRIINTDLQLSYETPSFTNMEIEVLGREGLYCVKKHSNSKSKYPEEDIIKMLEFLIENIFMVFGQKFSNK